MQQAIEWKSTINGKNYAFSYQKIQGKHTLTVNGVSNTIKSGFISSMFGFDEKFDLDGTEARLVIQKNQPDIVVNGVYIKSGKQYIPWQSWSFIFAVICIAIPFVSLGGALPGAIGFGSAALCVVAARNPQPIAVRVLICTLITASAWALWFLILKAVLSL
ncbi:MAG: hypothetical protein FWD39_00870 [Clostridiales bacterium]|nr:hypothetical protein [Clostridiales bacterium]